MFEIKIICDGCGKSLYDKADGNGKGLCNLSTMRILAKHKGWKVSRNRVQCTFCKKSNR